MNVPVPSIFLFDTGEYKYEVLDGQQRVSTIVDYLEGRFELEGLKVWPQINGRTFKKLPPALRRGLTRAKLTATILLTDPISQETEKVDLRSQVFDRLNTGGGKLNPQELRNCLYSGPFNQMIVRLSGLTQFTKAWNIPDRKRHTLSDGTYDDTLRDNRLFSTMGDCQIVLRYFAFKDSEHVVGATRTILDNCMRRHRNADETQIEIMENEFVESLDLAIEVFGSKAFRADYGEKRKGRLSRPLFDAEMIALHELRDRKDELIAAKKKIVGAVGELTKPETETYETVIGRPNTAKAIKARQLEVKKAMLSAL